MRFYGEGNESRTHAETAAIRAAIQKRGEDVSRGKGHAAASCRAFYEAAREEAMADFQRKKRETHRLVLLRTVSFLAMLFAFAAGWDGTHAFLLVGILLLVTFFAFVRRHRQTLEKMDYLESRLDLIDWYLARIDGHWIEPPKVKLDENGQEEEVELPPDDDGRDFLREDLPQGVDLHLFGRASLFQYMSAAMTKRGREKLAAALSPTPKDTAAIKAHQEAAGELIEDKPLVLSLLEISSRLPAKHDPAALVSAVAGKTNKLRLPHWLLALRFLPILTFASLLAALFGACSIRVPELLFLLSLIIASASYPLTSAAFSPIALAAQDLKLYEKLFTRIEAKKFSSTALQNIAAPLLSPRSAASGLKKLAQIASLASARENIFFFALANTLFLWDFHVLTAYGKWQKNSGSRLTDWLAVWSEFELCLSLSVIGTTRETWLFPTIKEGDTPFFEGKGLLTPLIGEAQATANDASLSNKTTIITGSNMSGKTTYLRTIGISAILAYAGAPVCAKKLTLSPMRIFTSIQVNDDLSRGISTFYAEILRIKQMVEHAKKRDPMLSLIDEIFKGTNSADRIYGAEETVRRLARPWCITLVTTHDFELCDLEAEGGVENCHFEEHYKDGKILFDYKRKEGRCHTTNAKYLLKMAGIAPED